MLKISFSIFMRGILIWKLKNTIYSQLTPFIYNIAEKRLLKITDWNMVKATSKYTFLNILFMYDMGHSMTDRPT